MVDDKNVTVTATQHDYADLLEKAMAFEWIANNCQVIHVVSKYGEHRMRGGEWREGCDEYGETVSLADWVTRESEREPVE